MNNLLHITRIIFLLIISLYTLYFVNFSKIITDWVAVDLLINYEGGLVRRGLLGHINLFFETKLLYNLSHKFGISVSVMSVFTGFPRKFAELVNN